MSCGVIRPVLSGLCSLFQPGGASTVQDVLSIDACHHDGVSAAGGKCRAEEDLEESAEWRKIWEEFRVATKVP